MRAIVGGAKAQPATILHACMHEVHDTGFGIDYDDVTVWIPTMHAESNYNVWIPSHASRYTRYTHAHAFAKR